MNTLNVEYRKVEALIPYACNPRTHTDEQVAKIAASIVEYGWTNPVLVDGDNGIIAGHGRPRQRSHPVLGWLARMDAHTALAAFRVVHLGSGARDAR